MENIVKKTLRGLFLGIGAGALVCVAVLLFEIFGFMDKFESWDVSKFELTIWSVSTYILVLVIGAVGGLIVGIVIGIVTNLDSSRKSISNKMEEQSEGAIRQRRRFASEIKTMSDEALNSCEEKLASAKNIVPAAYRSEKIMGEIMTELVKFTEYERVLKDAQADINSKGEAVS